MSNFTVRTVSGVIYVILVVLAVWFGPLSLSVFLLAPAVLATYELGILLSLNPKERILLLIPSSVLYLSLILTVILGEPAWLIIPSLVYLLILVSLLFYKNVDPGKTSSAVFFSGAYVVLPLISLVAIHVLNPDDGRVILLGVFSLIWSNDTFAYLTGKITGKHRLFPSVSPGKTWEGTLGGALITLVLAWVAYNITGAMSMTTWLLMALIIIIFGTFGDLFESLLKRRAGVKDSGNLMPGHGGILDRFDSILFAGPAVLIFLLIEKIL